jgi:hypothetical protein
VLENESPVFVEGIEWFAQSAQNNVAGKHSARGTAKGSEGDVDCEERGGQTLWMQGCSRRLN